MRTLIVDDEPPARAELRYQLECHPDVEVVGEAANAREAEQLLAALDYQAIFIDIQMPGMSGLDLIHRLHQGQVRPPYVVFVTAHSRHAVAAFHLGAIDYLLKPVTPARLADTLNRIRAFLGRQDSPPVESEDHSEGLRFVLATDRDRTIPVAWEDIAYVVAEGDAVWLTTLQRQRLRVRTTLQALERRLPADIFVRCHRSYLVNIRQVQEIQPFFNGTYTLRMRGGGHETIPVSRRNVRRLREAFGFSRP
ncbi:MAG: LytTR family transcriptional regulator DNA-binding domain-containing protein [Firmicutes bacterium]|nr:LytTR family transcriptional regulator DNA-binding domain-containing protein [Alicyclobacillaceae bacterium]MCL6496401.1 LytTR family transcriptional regulator DNA-binding domain-containing protein [Bacillota bacterium]